MPLQSAAALRRMADAAVAQGDYAKASELYRKEAAARRAMGDPNGAKVEEMKADRYSSGIQVFAHLPDATTPRAALPKDADFAKWEPAYGCYIGAFLDRDERLGRAFKDENHQSHYDPDVFGRMVGKKHASAFCYVAYGKPFPARWVARLRGQGIAPHIAFEPNQGLGVVEADQYLRTFAREAARARCPIFLRFASEMNGDWTRYGGDPLQYKIKWGVVKQVMEQEAPNVAMVWCVNCIPEKPILSFYPGDGHVDWVGINFYAVPFHDNDRNRPGLHENPADQLKYVYANFAARKPIMICEFGASRLSSVDRQERANWASQKIHELYAALPRLYPRVKMVDIFNNDNLTYAMPGRQLNNYSITDTEQVRDAYARAVAPDYFLSDVGSGSSLFGKKPTPIVPVSNSGVTVPRGILRVSSWARCHDPRFAVQYKLNGKDAGTMREPGPREAELRLEKPGPHVLTAAVFDSKGRLAARKDFKIIAK